MIIIIINIIINISIIIIIVVIGLIVVCYKKTTPTHRRHSRLNEIMRRSVKRAQIPVARESVGFSPVCHSAQNPTYQPLPSAPPITHTNTSHPFPPTQPLTLSYSFTLNPTPQTPIPSPSLSTLSHPTASNPLPMHINRSSQLLA